ncbi:SCO6880 family protein, partial [Streptomyces sp. 12297]
MSHQIHPVAPRRTYLIGRARPNAIVGKNRESGEIALIIAGAFLGMMSGLLVPNLMLRIVALAGFPMVSLAMVYVPYKHRTFYKWFEINRTEQSVLLVQRERNRHGRGGVAGRDRDGRA